MKTLLLIDNQDITREGMKTVAGRIGGFAAIKEAGSQSELTGQRIFLVGKLSFKRIA